jgi:hypothetical protein
MPGRPPSERHRAQSPTPMCACRVAVRRFALQAIGPARALLTPSAPLFSARFAFSWTHVLVRTCTCCRCPATVYWTTLVPADDYHTAKLSRSLTALSRVVRRSHRYRPVRPCEPSPTDHGRSGGALTPPRRRRSDTRASVPLTAAEPAEVAKRDSEPGNQSNRCICILGKAP